MLLIIEPSVAVFGRLARRLRHRHVERLDEVLRGDGRRRPQHPPAVTQAPLLLAVRPDATKALTAWHAASVDDERVLPALERLARSSSEYAGRT